MNSMMRKLIGYVGLFMSLALAAQAGQYWWSGNGTTLGGNGTWNATSTTNWGTSVAGPFNMSWPNGGGDEAVFTNTSGTVTLGTTVNLNAMTFTANNVMTFNSGTLNFGSAAATLSISNDANVTINSALAGSGTLTLKTAKNTWQRGFTLYGNNSAFTGKLVAQLTSGSYFWLYATNDFNFGAVPVVYTADALTLNGVNLQNASSKVIDISATRGITLGSGGGSFYNGALGTISLNSMITGSGGLTLDASTGVINLNNTNSYAGTLSLYGGKTVINIDNALPHGAGKGDVWFRCWNSPVTFDLNGHVVTINAVYDQGGTHGPSSCIDNSAAGPATLIVGDGDKGNTFPRTIKNTGGALSLTKIGTGTQTLTGTNTYSGATTVNGGTLVFSGFLSNAVPLTVNVGGTLQADLSVNTNGVFNSASAVTLAGGTLNIKGKNSGTSATALGNLNVDPAGSTISLTPNGGGGTTLSLSNAWTRQVGGTLLADLSTAGSTLASSPTLTNGIIGGYAFVKDGTGTGFGTVSGGNVVRYTGATVLDAAAAAGNLDGTVNYVVTNSVALSGSSATQTVNSLFFSGTGSFGGNVKVVVVGAGGIIQSYATWTRLTSNEKLTSGTGDLVINILGSAPDVAAIVDNGAAKVGFTKTGAGSLLINAGNTYSGNTVINQGALVRGSCIPNGYGKGDLLVNAGAYFEMGGGSGGINGLSQSTNNTGGTVQNTYYATQVTLTLGNGDASANFAGVIAGTYPGIALVKIGTGTQTLSGVNTYAGGTILSNGVLSVSSLSNIGGANAKVTFAGGTLRITGTTFTGFGATPVTVSGNVGLDIVESTNAFTFTNNVSGTLTKSGNGSLSVSGSVASLVTDNRTLVSGSGSVAAWTLKSLTGGAYTPAGIEAVTGTLTLEGNYTFDLNTDGSGDKLTATGAVTMNSMVITIPVPANLTDKSKVYTLVQGSSLSGSFSLASVLPQDWKLKKEGNALVVRYVSPGTMVSFY